MRLSDNLTYDEVKMIAEMTAFHEKCDRVDEAVAFIRSFYKSVWTRFTTAEDEQKFENIMCELDFILDEAMGHFIEFQWEDAWKTSK